MMEDFSSASEKNSKLDSINEIEMMNISADQVVINVRHDNMIGDDDDDNKEVKVTQKWIKISIVLIFTALLCLFGLPYVHNNGYIVPKNEVFEDNPVSFVSLLFLLMLSFFFGVNGVVFRAESTKLSMICSFMSITGTILCFTVLTWALLPPQLSLAPWLFFGFSFLAMIYRCCRSL